MSSNTLTRTNGHAITTPTHRDALATLPKWLQYLIGAYPSAKVTEATYLVYEDQFGNVPPAQMLTAVRTAVKRHKYHTFPSVAELRSIVDAMPDDSAPAPIGDLSRMRAELLEDAYSGVIDQDRWRKLIVFLRRCGRECAATAAQAKLARFMNQEVIAWQD